MVFPSRSVHMFKYLIPYSMTSSSIISVLGCRSHDNYFNINIIEQMDYTFRIPKENVLTSESMVFSSCLSGSASVTRNREFKHLFRKQYFYPDFLVFFCYWDRIFVRFSNFVTVVRKSEWIYLVGNNIVIRSPNNHLCTIF